MSFTAGIARRNSTSIDRLLNGDEPIYVVNNTEPRALLICTVNDPISGKAHTLNFARTFIPYCLTDMLPRQVLANSIQLRTYLQKGVLKVLTEQEALAILNSPEGNAEEERLMKSEYAKGGAMTNRKMSLMEQEKAAQAAVLSAGISNPSVDKSQLSLHPRVQTWEQRVLAGELDGSNLLTELRIHSHEFTIEDLKYLLTGQFPQEAKDFASKNIADGKYKAATPVTAAPQQQAAPKRTADDDYEADYEVG